jgi:hypothetical protein
MSFHSVPLEQRAKLKEKFRFGIEAEFLIVEAGTMKPLWHNSISFDRLKPILEGISLEGMPTMEGLELEPPMTKLMPYVVEGYHLPDMGERANELLPKGVEIRTPVCDSLEHVRVVYRTLHERLVEAFAKEGLAIVALSHHPIETKFSGPQNKRRHDYWQWSMEVMTTFGPDVNVSVAPELADLINQDDLEAKINYYGPALSALTVGAPFCEGKPWEMRGKRGKSFRMQKRSYIAPPIEFHPDEKNRLEFKVYDMPNSAKEMEAGFLAFLALVLDDSLAGRAYKQTRIYDLGQVARFGLQAEDMKERAAELLSKAPAVLKSWGFNPSALELFAERLETGRTPADEMLEIYDRTGSLAEVLRARSQFEF